MILSTPEIVAHSDGRTTASLPITVGKTKHRLYFTVSSGPISQGLEPFLALALLPAMRTGQEIVLQGPVSARLLASLATFQNRFSEWFPAFPPITVTPAAGTTDTESESGTGRGVGSFFTGGVDSFYTAHKHDAELDTLIFAHGFDIALEDRALCARVQERLTECAARMQKRLVTVETNLRSLLDPVADWGEHAHGVALASLALLLAPQLERVYLPSSSAFADLEPWGSHPDLDPLWSTEQVTLVHDGCEATRLQKTAAIANSEVAEVAMEFLRVCYENRGGRYNCGRCPKCLRTMVNLHAVGAGDRFRSFAVPLDLFAVARIPVYTPTHRRWIEQSLDALQARGGEARLEQALHDSLECKYYHGALKTLRDAWWKLKKRQWVVVGLGPHSGY